MTDAVAYAVVHTEPPSIFLADDIDVLHRVLALEVVARTDPALLGAGAASIREALLEERDRPGVRLGPRAPAREALLQRREPLVGTAGRDYLSIIGAEAGS